MMRRLFARWRWRTREPSRRLANDLGLPEDAVESILMEAMDGIHRIDEDDDAADLRPILEKVAKQIEALAADSRPSLESAVIEQYLSELPYCDYAALRYFKMGKSLAQIAEIMNTNVDTIRASLIRTYVDLRMRLSSGVGAR